MAVELGRLDFSVVRQHYVGRRRAHRRLRAFFEAGDARQFTELALGVTEAVGNYSAAEHRMGPVILASSSFRDVFELGEALDTCPHVNHVPRIIYEHGIPGLKISIGSEIAMMLHPKRFWVGNVRTVWSHLVIKHGMDDDRANEELRLYYDGERESEMNYDVWSHVYLRMEPDIRTLGQLAADAARDQGVEPGRIRYMWADAVASFLFEEFAVARSR